MGDRPSNQHGERNGIHLAGDLCIDVGQQRVLRAGKEVELPNLSFQLLVALVEAAPNVVSSEALMTRVWPGLVVSPETVNKRVNLLRDALGDDAREPRYIAGVRSRGYRLIAPVAARNAQSGDAQPGNAQPRDAKPGDESALARGSKTSSVPGRAVAIAAAAAVVALSVAAAALWKWPTRATAGSGDSSAPFAAADVNAHTVAVLPFDSLSAESADAFLAQGLPEMILNRLSRVEGMTVIARSSSFVLPAKTMDSREIGRRLNAGYLVGGSVQHEGERLRVDVHLVDAASGVLVWSSGFDRSLHDIFALEDEISDQLADVLAARTGSDKQRPSPHEPVHNVAAYLEFLKGRSLLGRFTVSESEAAVPHFEKAIALDPQLAAAYASLYDARMQAAERRGQDLAPLRERYRPLIQQALSIDPQSGAAYFARAMWGNTDVALREADYRRGVALDPSNGRGLTDFADFLMNDTPDDRSAECQRVLRRALQIDPISPMAHFESAVWDTEPGSAKSAVVESRVLAVLELDPNFVPALSRYGKYRWLFEGKFAEAITFEERAIAQDPSNPWTRQIATAIYLDLGDETAARDVALGTPGGAAISALLLAMHRGDWRAAGVAALGPAPWNDRNVYDDWQAGEALRDYALRTSEFDAPIAMLTAKYGLAGVPQERLTLENFRQAFYLSQLLAARGDKVAASKLRYAVAAWNDAHEATMGSVYARRVRASILLADGKRDAALAELAASFESGDYETWWYTLKFDPTWLPLHDDPRFKTIAADVARHVASQRAELEALRQKGAVPRRVAVAVAARRGR